MVDLILAKGAPLDGDGTDGPLVLALQAMTPVYAHALLLAGASPTPAGDLLAAFRATTALAAALTVAFAPQCVTVATRR